MILFLKRKSISLTHSFGLYKFDKTAFVSSFVIWFIVAALSYLYGYLLDIEIPEDFVNLTKAAPPLLINCHCIYHWSTNCRRSFNGSIILTDIVDIYSRSI